MQAAEMEAGEGGVYGKPLPLALRRTHRQNAGAKRKEALKAEKESPTPPKEKPKDGNKKKRKRPASVASSLTSVPGSPKSDPRHAADFVRSAKVKKPVSSMIKKLHPQHDFYCWECHKQEAGNKFVYCGVCPRACHVSCTKLARTIPDWVCAECERITEAECTDTQSSAMANMSLGKIAKVLRCALDKARALSSAALFSKPVDRKEYPDYGDFVFNPVDLHKIELMIQRMEFGSTEAFLAELKWIIHNSLVYFGSGSKHGNGAKGILKTCEIELGEIEACPDCYLASISKRPGWFIEVCTKPHKLIWAKLQGFPFWPAKAVKEQDGLVEARFFGQHDRAMIPPHNCFLYSTKIPFPPSKKRMGGLNNAIKEADQLVEKLKQTPGGYQHAPHLTPYDPNRLYTTNSLVVMPGGKVKSLLDANRNAKLRAQAMENGTVEPGKSEGAEGEGGGNSSKSADITSKEGPDMENLDIAESSKTDHEETAKISSLTDETSKTSSLDEEDSNDISLENGPKDISLGADSSKDVPLEDNSKNDSIGDTTSKATSYEEEHCYVMPQSNKSEESSESKLEDSSEVTKDVDKVQIAKEDVTVTTSRKRKLSDHSSDMPDKLQRTDSPVQDSGSLSLDEEGEEDDDGDANFTGDETLESVEEEEEDEEGKEEDEEVKSQAERESSGQPMKAEDIPNDMSETLKQGAPEQMTEEGSKTAASTDDKDGNAGQGDAAAMEMEEKLQDKDESDAALDEMDGTEQELSNTDKKDDSSENPKAKSLPEASLAKERKEVVDEEDDDNDDPGMYGNDSSSDGELLIDEGSCAEEYQANASKDTASADQKAVGKMATPKDASLQVNPSKIGQEELARTERSQTASDQMETDSDKGNDAAVKSEKPGAVAEGSPEKKPEEKDQSALFKDAPEVVKGTTKAPEKDPDYEKLIAKVVEDAVRSFKEVDAKVCDVTPDLRTLVLDLQREVVALRAKQELQQKELLHCNKMAAAEVAQVMEYSREAKLSQIKKRYDRRRDMAVLEAKKKQWCASCLGEANYFCCWNTSYCNYKCQENHWPKHEAKCQQKSGNFPFIADSDYDPFRKKKKKKRKKKAKDILAYEDEMDGESSGDDPSWEPDPEELPTMVQPQKKFMPAPNKSVSLQSLKPSSAGVKDGQNQNMQKIFNPTTKTWMLLPRGPVNKWYKPQTAPSGPGQTHVRGHAQRNALLNVVSQAQTLIQNQLQTVQGLVKPGVQPQQQMPSSDGTNALKQMRVMQYASGAPVSSNPKPNVVYVAAVPGMQQGQPRIQMASSVNTGGAAAGGAAVRNTIPMQLQVGAQGGPMNQVGVQSLVQALSQQPLQQGSKYVIALTNPPGGGTPQIQMVQTNAPAVTPGAPQPQVVTAAVPSVQVVQAPIPVPPSSGLDGTLPGGIQVVPAASVSMGQQAPLSGTPVPLLVNSQPAAGFPQGIVSSPDQEVVNVPTNIPAKALSTDIQANETEASASCDTSNSTKKASNDVAEAITLSVQSSSEQEEATPAVKTEVPATVLVS